MMPVANAGAGRIPPCRPPKVRGLEGQERHKTAVRRCLVTGEVLPKCELLRFVVGPEQRLVPDIKGTLPGRGLWLLPRRPIIEKACKRQLFAKAARASVQVDDDLCLQVRDQLRRRCLDLLGIARRAGQAVAGYEKVRTSLAGGSVGLLLAAGDGAEGGRRKLEGLAKAISPGLPLVDLFSSAELGAALGRDTVVHAAIAKGDLAAKLLGEIGRLAGLLEED